jgi:hypothetical protein
MSIATRYEFLRAHSTLEGVQKAFKRAAKQGVRFDARGRAFIPEALRGRGVGYNGKRTAHRSDNRA